MIKINDESREFKSTVLELCENSPFGSRIYSYFTAYDNKYPFIDSWLCSEDGRYTCVVCRYYNTVMICGEVTFEIAAFIAALAPGEIICDGASDIPLDMIWTKGEIMRCVKLNDKYCKNIDKFAIADIKGSINDLKQIYNLMADGFEFDPRAGFDDFAVDISHRIRHGTANIYAVRLQDKIVSSLTVSANSPNCAVISGIVTSPGSRCHGMGSALIAFAVNKLLSQGKNVYLQREKKIDIYEKMGFTVCGIWKEGRCSR